MDSPIEKTATAHESLSYLLHAIGPRPLIAIACAAASMTARELVVIEYRNPRIQVPGLNKRARDSVVDIVYTVHDSDASIVEVWIVEVELSLSLSKIRLWAHYEITYETECDAGARVVVFSPKPSVRARIRARVLARMKKTKPILIEPDQIERISDYEQARARPELAILGALYHAHEPAPFEARVEVVRAAWVALQSLEASTCLRYSVAVMSIVAHNIIDRAVADLRESGELDEDRYELVSESERDGHSFVQGHNEGLAAGREAGLAAGREEGLAAGREAGLAAGREEGLAAGREEGHCQALRRTIVDILELRGYTLVLAQRQRISACESLPTLERWYAAAKASAANQPVEQILS